MFAGAKRSPAHNRPWLYCPARERSMAVRPPDRERSMTAQALGRRHSTAPLVQRGGSMAKPCKGGLTALNCLDDTSCQVWDLVAGCPQSLSRRSPTAPFAQGSRLCRIAPNQRGGSVSGHSYCGGVTPRTYCAPALGSETERKAKKLPQWGSFSFYAGELYYQVQQFREIKRSSYRTLVE